MPVNMPGARSVPQAGVQGRERQERLAFVEFLHDGEDRQEASTQTISLYGG